MFFNLALYFNRAGSHFLSKHCLYFHWNIVIPLISVEQDLIGFLYYIMYYILISAEQVLIGIFILYHVLDLYV